MTLTTPRFEDLYFGKSDSKNELSGGRDDFVRSFVDLNRITDAVVSGEKTMVLGPKGTGKSALAWYLHESQHLNDYLCVVRDASELPLADIPRLDTGQPAGTDRTVSAWKFILLCNYLALLLEDQSCDLPNRTEVTRVTRLLRQYGLLGDTSGRAILNVSNTTIEIPIPKLGTVYRRESRTKLNIFSLLPYLEEWAANARSGNRHLLMLDGLDSIFLNDEKYDESLASLVQAAYSINQRLSNTGATGTIVLLLRNDVFNRVSLTLPDSQKMRDDFSVELDWRVLSGAAGINAPLIRLVNGKAAKALEVDRVDVLEYFPKNIELHGKSHRTINRLQYLLNFTRHTPRDLLRLLDAIRDVEASQVFPASQQQLRQDVIREGVLQYATRYFPGAIRNEFAGYEFGPDEASKALDTLQTLQRQRFDRAAFAHQLKTLGVTEDTVVNRLLKLLFFAGAIGNEVQIRGGSYMQFYHRRDDAQLYLHGSFILHNALCHAWNIPFSA
ncbi:hypothetical protein BIU95_07265 [Curtobacterium sp. MCBA15_007]|uniref:P-loop ATPase, Sll1717 family n=1 Tax=Curtobacterium sp. MCBA15_007 TaxID=1898735 RepID=UPI0008DCC362|nr:hypothetical protein [Curtobacterium sp. MCBA15_007]OII01477.1 hypothetical protein BIU95_07265 [Curtobacterium sp. MCBA15_007]